MKTPLESVVEFHTAFGLLVQGLPNFVPDDVRDLRIKLLREETDEAIEAMLDDCNLVSIAQELADVVYVAYGAAASYGINLDLVFAEVHRANMSKLADDGTVLRRADGKILKGERYRLPDIAGTLYARRMSRPGTTDGTIDAKR